MLEVFRQFGGYFSRGLLSLADAFSFLGGHKWAAAIVALTLIVRTLLLPLAVKQIKSMREQQRLQPEINRLRQKYRNDRQAMTQELMALYQREGVNPYAACLPLVIQTPILIATYYAIRKITGVSKGYIEAHHLTHKSASEIMSYAQAHHVIPKMPFLGLGDLAHPTASSAAGWLLVGLTVILSFLATRQINVAQTEQQRRMQMLMPLVFVFFFLRYPAALVLYWATQQLYQYVQQLVMTRDMRRGGGWRAVLLGPSTAQPPVVKPKVAQGLSAPRVVAGGGVDGVARRDIDEKRRRRRARKRKKRRR